MTIINVFGLFRSGEWSVSLTLSAISSRMCSVFAHREGEDGTWDLLGAVVTPDDRTAFTVSELKPYTAYSFRVLGVNELGQGAPSNASYFIFTHRQRESGPPISGSAPLSFSVTFPPNGGSADIL